MKGLDLISKNKCLCCLDAELFWQALTRAELFQQAEAHAFIRHVLTFFKSSLFALKHTFSPYFLRQP